ncbi:MAG TPA: glutamate formimidoyltransferase [Chitinophagales bacterium]|nr:glutamate formimidoyltransferase [Chitinophagales bacterium]HNF70050.1 glutamate formimidoyltransferase [Chitinophagales bacterium]HNI53555.1 glutamate formimidoyltransferase [Chitinophagales bacterium]HNJ88578.1 glutamate formimidoyltransferase [Chitinophagales bacterium]HNK97943.1 glutamate formimidoyltransferase [Chitinophagales bacterium]
MRQIIECVPNFSEGRDMQIIRQITDAISSVEGVTLLDVDPGKATNRTVVTFVGDADAVVEAAYRGIAKAAEVIDMRKHHGEHPRMGATDVCPFVPVANATMEDCIACAKKLGERVGSTLNIPVYLYESAATSPERKNLATIRAGEYEGIEKKILDPMWKPDFGPAQFNPQTGNCIIGARDFLVAFNVNLNTTSVRRANSIAFDVRENGRVDPSGAKDAQGEALRIPGACKSVKAIGWFIEEYGIAQVSMNLTNIRDTPVHIAFDACVNSAASRGMRVTGSELVGLIPLQCLIDAGKYFLEKQERSIGVSEEELIKIAVKSMGLDELAPFNPADKIIEYKLGSTTGKLVSMNLRAFANETASESPAPGGGSIAAYCGALGISLATMVANLSSHKKGWDARWKEFSDVADKGQQLKDRLLFMVDEDTAAFNKIMDAFGLPKATPDEKSARKKAIQDATVYAIEVPFKVMQLSFESMALIKAMAENGNPNSVSDAGVGALCARTAVLGAFLNVKINASGLDDKALAANKIAMAQKIADDAMAMEKEILSIVDSKIG